MEYPLDDVSSEDSFEPLGIFDPATEAFTTVSPESLQAHGKFHGAAIAGDGRVIFAPLSANVVGIFDPALACSSAKDFCGGAKGAKVNIDINAASAVFLAGLGISTAALLWTCVSRRSQKSL